MIFKDDSQNIFHFDYEKIEARETVIKWLDDQKVPYAPCMGIASENCLEPYTGNLYLDVPFDEGDESYKKLAEFFEHPDGSMKFDDVVFVYCPLDMAMKNAHHDEPGFWDDWARNF
ncbi:hypothetical protein [Endozoicomonas montiporae]|uniref:Uncharacterized protein n=1 Tax=Endozoicomonas montiporae CL-33 TaxID=570277 RepID=A0A142BBV8_9GAMM|nr:hypothetical protein [Endozoicomonas montiporae]AMO56234.1 hypothetical protein EZMO1_2119 [Endozoicomonas montiporae CL-33]